jgi:hypothetical protein
MNGAAMTRMGGAVLKMLTPPVGLRRRRKRGGKGRGKADGEAPGKPRPRPGLNGYDRIALDSAALGNRLEARGAFAMLALEREVARAASGAPDEAVRTALAPGARGGASELTIEGLEAYAFAASLRYAHIPGANLKLRAFPTPLRGKSFLVLFFKKERLLSCFHPLRGLLRFLLTQISSAERIM